MIFGLMRPTMVLVAAWRHLASIIPGDDIRPGAGLLCTRALLHV